MFITIRARNVHGGFSEKNRKIFDLKWPLKAWDIFFGHGVNTKVVDIDEIYLNMRNEQNR